MTKEELRRTLQKGNVPSYLYNLDGTGRTDERLCLAFSDNTWYVFFEERGVKTMREKFASEDSACEFILRQLLRQMEGFKSDNILKKDWLFAADEYICDLRTAAVLVKDGKILVQKDRNGTEYALPGGHVKIGETLEDGLIRETMEEMGVRIKCKRLLWSEECFWEWNGRQAHNIAFYYQIELCDDLEIPPNGEFVSQKDNCDVVIGWIPVEEIQRITIYPEFLKKEIYHLDEPIKHFVSRG